MPAPRARASGAGARVAAIAPLNGHIYLTVGESDEFDLRPPTVAFSKALSAAGIGNELVVLSGGHDGIAEHMAAIVKFLAASSSPRPIEFVI